MRNNANTHFMKNARHYLALMEAGKPTELTRDLAIIGEFDFGGRLEEPMTAHPKIDSETGGVIFFGYDLSPVTARFVLSRGPIRR